MEWKLKTRKWVRNYVGHFPKAVRYVKPGCFVYSVLELCANLSAKQIVYSYHTRIFWRLGR